MLLHGFSGQRGSIDHGRYETGKLRENLAIMRITAPVEYPFRKGKRDSS
jgi:hypothetical protein